MPTTEGYTIAAPDDHRSEILRRERLELDRHDPSSQGLEIHMGDFVPPPFPCPPKISRFTSLFGNTPLEN